MKRKINTKQVAALLTMTAFMFSTTPALAQVGSTGVTKSVVIGENTEITMEQAISIAQKTFKIPADLVKTNASYQTNDYNGRSTWQFNWNRNTTGANWHNLSVEVDAVTGEIVNFWEDQSTGDQSGKNQEPQYNREQCQKIAEEFIKKLQPTRLTETKLAEISKAELLMRSDWIPPAYDFYYQRVVNGIVFNENGINIGINNMTGKVVRYNFNWENLSFPSPQAVIGQDAARQAVQQEMGYGLKYLRPETPFPVINARKEAKLYYAPRSLYGNSVYVDATTGKLVSWGGEEVIIPVLPKVESQTVVTEAYQDVDGEGDTGPSTTLTKDEAIAAVNKYVDIPTNYKVRSIRYNEGWGWGSSKTWEFEYVPQGQNSGEPYNVSIDAVTGDLKGYWHWNNLGGQKAQYSWEQGKKIVLDFIKKVQPEKSQQVLLQSEEPKMEKMRPGEIVNYSYRFVRLVNGVPFEQNNMYIDFNAATGEVNGFNMYWDNDAKFSKMENLISESEAIDKIFADNSLELRYIRKYSTGYEYSKDVMLVYAFKDELPRVVNAVTGEVVTQGQLEYKDQLNSLVDVKSHWAGDKINGLASVGIVSGSKDGKFQPNQSINRAEFVKLLVTALGLDLVKPETATFDDVNKDQWYYAYVETAVKHGIITGNGKKMNPTSPISREELTVMVVRALKLEAPETGNLQFKDANQVSVWAKGPIAKAVELGIMTGGTNNTFRPKANTTKAEAAVIIYRILSDQSDSAKEKAMNVSAVPRG